MTEDPFVKKEDMSDEAQDWVFGQQGDDIIGNEYTVGESEDMLVAFDPKEHSGWHVVVCTEFTDDPTNVFGERSPNAGQSAPLITLKWEVISLDALKLDKNPHPEKTILMPKQ